MTRLIFASATFAAVLLAGAASAAEWRVPVGDLDLSTPRGASTLDRRIDRAAFDACRGGSPLQQSRCRTAFRAEAMDNLRPALRDDYARVRTERMVVRAPVDPT